MREGAARLERTSMQKQLELEAYRERTQTEIGAIRLNHRSLADGGPDAAIDFFNPVASECAGRHEGQRLPPYRSLETLDLAGQLIQLKYNVPADQDNDEQADPVIAARKAQIAAGEVGGVLPDHGPK